MAKRKNKFNSLSTPGLRQELSNYLVELAFLRSNKLIRLPQKFWQLVKYKFRYRREIMACRKFIKKYGEATILFIAQNNYVISWTDYAKIEVLLQKYKESQDRLLLPKDFSSVPSSIKKRGVDLRESSSLPSKKGLFEKLEEIEKCLD